MTDLIQQARRELFEESMQRLIPSCSGWNEQDESGSYLVASVQVAWLLLSAALDSLEIKFPLEAKLAFHEYDLGYNEAVDQCRAAIESTNLGMRIK